MRSGIRPHVQALDSGEDLRTLDVEVGIRLMSYRWVEWNHSRLGGAPIDEPGSFLAARDDPLSHLYMPADPATAPRCDAFARLPRFSVALDHAFAAADSARLFTDGDAAISRWADAWLLEIRANGQRFAGRERAAILCRASLAWSRDAGNATRPP